MAKKKILAVKFDKTNKKNFTGLVGHTRTGASVRRASPD